MNKTERLRHLFDRYVNNACTREEMDEFFQFIEDSRYDKEVKVILDELWEGRTQLAVDATRQANKRQSPRYLYWKVAAAVTIVLTLAFAARFWGAGGAISGSSAEVAALVSKSTRDERRLIILPDGSSVWLNRESKLEFPVEFPGTHREVTLIGEAFFDIRKDSLRPFTIYSGRITTTVLGTAFNIRAFPDEKAVTVTVSRGRVMVRDDEKHERILEANQQISFAPSVHAPIPHVAEADSVSGWIHQDLVLDNITFEEAASVIEDRYSVKVQFDNEALKHCRFTSTFLHGARLDQMLTAICIVNRATFSLQADTVLISGEGCENEMNRTDD